VLPLEPVNHARLERLRAERATARAELVRGASSFSDRRRRAQIAARHALQEVTAAISARGKGRQERERLFASTVHAAELQLPEAWLPFVVRY
jgi:hypothetical protein